MDCVVAFRINQQHKVVMTELDTSVATVLFKERFNPMSDSCNYRWRRLWNSLCSLSCWCNLTNVDHSFAPHANWTIFFTLTVSVWRHTWDAASFLMTMKFVKNLNLFLCYMWFKILRWHVTSIMAAMDLHSSNITGQKMNSGSRDILDKVLKHLSHTYYKHLPAGRAFLSII